jgi:hypothetical protein
MPPELTPPELVRSEPARLKRAHDLIEFSQSPLRWFRAADEDPPDTAPFDEALRMADIASDMFTKTIDTFTRDDAELIERIQAQDDQVDTLDREIKHYLTKLPQQGLTAEQSKREIGILSFVNNLENIGLLTTSTHRLREPLTECAVDANERFLLTMLCRRCRTIRHLKLL